MIDEITSVLDVYGRQFYLNLFREYIEKNGTIFLTTNIITEVSPFIDHIFVIRKGQLVFDDQKINISKEVVRIKKDYDGELPTDHLNLSSYYLIAASEADSIGVQYIDKATTEDLFFFIGIKVKGIMLKLLKLYINDYSKVNHYLYSLHYRRDCSLLPFSRRYHRTNHLYELGTLYCDVWCFLLPLFL